MFGLVILDFCGFEIYLDKFSDFFCFLVVLFGIK